MTGLAFELSPPTQPLLGLVVLQADEVIEQDFRRLLPPDLVRLLVSRVPSGQDLTPETIGQMEHDLPQAVRLLPRGAAFASVGYACTSGTTLIGQERVAELVRSNTSAAHVTDPLSAAFAAVRALGIRRLGIVSPYVASVAGPIRKAFEAQGLTVPDTLSFGEQVEARVARIAPHSIAEAARTLATRTPLDALFLSCTNLRTLDIIAPVEAELGLPVLSSNQVLAWHMLGAAGVGVPKGVPGVLFGR